MSIISIEFLRRKFPGVVVTVVKDISELLKT